MAESRPVDLSKHETDVLLGLYSGCECLWNIKNPDYKVKKIRIGALRTVVNGMRLETGKNYNISQMEATLDQIREEYSRELHRAMEAEKSPGTDFKSTWRWFQFLDSFLRDNILNAQSMEIEVNSGGQESAVQGDDLNDTEDFYCPLADSGDEDYRPPPAKDKVLVQVLHNPSKSAKSSSRPVRNRTQRVSTSALLNGADYDVDFDLDEVPSRKKRRSNASSSSSKNRNSSSHSKHNSSKSSSRLFISESDKPDVNEQMADTLKSMQVLLATTLSDQDQPSLVFAKHIANELQQITDYTLRKQCMLDVQQLILRYQTKQQASESASIKFEGRCEQEGETMRAGNRPTASSSQSHTADDSLLLYFDTP